MQSTTKVNVCVIEREGGGEIHRDKERQRETEGETDRQRSVHCDL